MASKKPKFNVEASSLFSQAETPEEPITKKLGRPKNEKIVRDNPVQEGLTADYTRATFIVEVDLLEKLKDHAYTERLSLKDLINKILKDYIDKNVDEKKLLHRPDNWR